MSEVANALAAIEWAAMAASLAERNYAVTPPLFSAGTCGDIAAMYDDARRFRSTVTMAPHGFGRGEYRYFAAPLPPFVAALREALYPPLARIANDWADALGGERWPDAHAGLVERCRAAGQMRPTPLMLRYGPGDFNCLHQDLYGPVHFPLQAVVQLDRPGEDFEGGALVVVETRPRMQSRCEAVMVPQGAIAIFPVRERPRRGSRGVYRTQVRHGVASIDRGLRRTLGIIFHDAS